LIVVGAATEIMWFFDIGVWTMIAATMAGVQVPVCRRTGHSPGCAGGRDPEPQSADGRVRVPADGVRDDRAALVLEHPLPQPRRFGLRDEYGDLGARVTPGEFRT
jgi:hypothetical protein